MGTLTENKALVRRFVECINARDLDGLERVVSRSFERHCPATPGVEVRGFEDFRRFLEEDDWGVFPDSRVTLETLVAEGDRVGFWATWAGTQRSALGPFPADGKRARLEFSGVFRISRGRITDLRLTWDNVSLLQQLGHMKTSDTAL